MHLQQTKAASRTSGGPQYYFHSVPDHIKEFLRKRGACPVVLQTPYGITRSEFQAVDRDHKLVGDKVLKGSVGHDRIQQGKAGRSIGEEIRHWYGLKAGKDFEWIEVDGQIHPDGHFILVPTSVKMRDAKRQQSLERTHFPLSFNTKYQSSFWREHISRVRSRASKDVAWASSQILRVVSEHSNPEDKGILESDLLRVSGALSHLGVQLGPYLGTGYDCLRSTFQFDDFPTYPCPVEIKTRSKGFDYQVSRYTDLPRVVVLCMEHNLINPPEHVDVIELRELAKYLQAS
ncbi:MAG: hypothetical protein FLDDKLPJ_03513 [Phycisphaerae bacterium]|nr:hypothetical protein [Phycisphaerae bacterium]